MVLLLPVRLINYFRGLYFIIEKVLIVR